MEKEKKSIKILGITLWRLCAYFIIYSVVGFIIETLFAIVFHNVFESRQSFLYGPFCSIYGLGAVVMVPVLSKYFSKNGHTLFAGGFIVGSIVEYLVSLIGELIFNVRWWDYSHRFLNVNGRICFLYALFWGLLAIYLMKVINPKVDKFIDWTKKKINITFAKVATIVIMIFMLLDCVASGMAISCCLIRKSVENNLNIADKEKTEAAYHRIYDNEKTKEFIYKYWGDEKVVKTYPNLTLSLQNGDKVYIRDLTPEIKPYYYKFKGNK